MCLSLLFGSFCRATAVRSERLIWCLSFDSFLSRYMDSMFGRKTMNMGFHDCSSQPHQPKPHARVLLEPTFVFLVRFRTSPCLIIRSNSKLPFCVTGEKVSTVKWLGRNALAAGGIPKLVGVETVRPALAVLLGGVATSAMVLE